MRVRKKENPYTQIYNSVFEDRTLSYQALGLLSYLLSKPNNWQVVMADVERKGVNGRESTRNAIKELVERGYIAREPKRDADTGRLKGWVYDVFEEPHGIPAPATLKRKSPSKANTVRRETRQTVKPSDGKTPPINKDCTKEVFVPRTPPPSKEGEEEMSSNQNPGDDDMPITRKGFRSSKDPTFPRDAQGNPDWVEAVKQDDLIPAQAFCRIYPNDGNNPLTSQPIARAYYKHRQTNLSDYAVVLLSAYLRKARWEPLVEKGEKTPPVPLWKRARTYHELLGVKEPGDALHACRAAALEDLDVLQGQIDDADDAAMCYHLAGSKREMVTAAADMKGFNRENHACAAFAAAALIQKTVTAEDLALCRENLKTDLWRCPAWAKIVDPLAAFGFDRATVDQWREELLSPLIAEVNDIKRILKL
jgi:hypothetical protein